MGGKGYLVRFIRNKSVEQTLLNLTKILNITDEIYISLIFSNKSLIIII